MDATVVRASGMRVGKGKYAGTIWSYNGSLWMIFKKTDRFAYCWGKA